MIDKHITVTITGKDADVKDVLHTVMDNLEMDGVLVKGPRGVSNRAFQNCTGAWAATVTTANNQIRPFVDVVITGPEGSGKSRFARALKQTLQNQYFVCGHRLEEMETDPGFLAAKGRRVLISEAIG